MLIPFKIQMLLVPGGLAVLLLEGNDAEASGELGREGGVGVDVGGHGGGDRGYQGTVIGGSNYGSGYR